MSNGFPPQPKSIIKIIMKKIKHFLELILLIVLLPLVGLLGIISIVIELFAEPKARFYPPNHWRNE